MVGAMKRLAALAALVALLMAFAWRARPRPLLFAPSFDAALASARAGGEWVVVHVRSSGRPLGSRMDHETLSSPLVRRSAAADFLHVRLDVEREPELAARFAGSGAALSTLVVDERGELVARRDGWLDAEGFVALLDAVRAHRPALDAARRRLDADERDDAARVDLAAGLAELGASDRAELELRRTLATEDDATRARAVALLADLLAARGQIAASEALRRELADSYPAAPSR